MTHDTLAALQARVQQLEKELAAARAEIIRLQQGIKASEVTEGQISITEFEETLKRLVNRVAMILQAEKCVIMILDKESGELVARAPAYGISADDLRLLRVKVAEGVVGEVFRTERPAIVSDALHDPRTAPENLARLNIRNGVIVPLVVERRDDDNRVIDRVPIGVLSVYNKRYGGEFNEEDISLLERMSRNAASVIANAQMYHELVEEKEKLAHTIESLYAGLILIGSKGNLMQMNARARLIFGVRDNPVGKQYREVIQHEAALAAIERMLALGTRGENGLSDLDGNQIAEEISVIDPETGEEHIYQMHAAQVRDEQQTYIGTAIIFNDVTELRNLERMKTEFVAIAAHELRTPMTPIKGFISMLAQDKDDSFTFEERQEYYGIIEQNVDRLSRLINDLLNVTRIERGVALQLFWEKVDLTELAECVFEVQRGMTNTEKHVLIVDSVPEHVYATVGKDQIEQVLQNLVSNAIKYSPNGGEVRIIIRDEPETNTVLVGVKDQGTGIPESARNRLFRPYIRIHNPQTASIKGTGIGLFLVKNLIEAHHGQIWVESEVGKGSTFWFRIPKEPTDISSGPVTVNPHE